MNDSDEVDTRSLKFPAIKYLGLKVILKKEKCS